MKQLIEKLNKIQTGLKAPKGQTNAFGKYKYRSCEDILEALKPLLKETGTALVLHDQIEFIGDWHYVKATAQLFDGDHNMSAFAYARESEIKKGMDSAQITGAASSYARKYALNGLFCIDDTKDADTKDNSEQKSETVKESVKATSDTSLIKTINEKAKKLFDGQDAFHVWLVDNNLSETPKEADAFGQAKILNKLKEKERSNG